MSGIFGIYNRNGESVDKETVDVMLDAMSYWGPDDKGTWIDDNVALGHTMLWNTPESKFEHQPSRQEHLVITMDARLDNREELAGQVDLPDRPIAEITDSDFILAAYKKWGEESPKYLLGDFAFAIWDEEKEQLFCARDHMGIKPFYYFSDTERWIFASNVRTVIEHSSVPRHWDIQTVARYLRELESGHDTFFYAVKKLPPATSITINCEYVHTRIYWKPEDSPKIKFKNMEEYAIALRKLLEDAVHVRLRSDFPVGSHLSGGLDSSPIAVLAARQLKDKNQILHGFNWLHTPGTDDDSTHYEWSNSQRIADKEGIKLHFTDLDEHTIYERFQNHDLSTDDKQNFWYEFLVRKAAKREKIHTMLSGWGGDELISFGGGKAHYSGLFWKGHLFKALRGIYQESHSVQHQWKRFIKRCFHELVLQILPDWIYCNRKDNPCFYDDYSACAQPEIREYAQKMKPLTRQKRIGTHAYQLMSFHNGHLLNRIESWAISGEADKIEYRYPLLDKRIVEFALGVPEEVYVHNGFRRYLFRSSLNGLLPEDVQWKDAKYELHRVKYLLNISILAIDKWYKNSYTKKECYEQSNNIDYDSLSITIEELQNKEFDMSKKILKVFTIEKSILLLNMECRDNGIVDKA